MTIALRSVLPLAGPAGDYKLRLACWNGKEHPLDVFVRSRDEWDGSNRWRRSKDDFSRPRILSFMEFYAEPDTWLFGGACRVVTRSPDAYAIDPGCDSREFVGRLTVRLRRPGRAKAFYLERYLKEIVVTELLKELYSGCAFPGYENICHDFGELETIVRQARPDWKAALESVKGVYLVTDRSNGKRYVGSAYGDAGIWSRWRAYVDTGHGWSDEFTKLVAAEGVGYARKHFRFARLEHRPVRTDDRAILEREQY
jgi:hypothetical protein